MRLIKRSTLLAYAAAHPDTGKSLTHWRMVAQAANWSSMDDVRWAFSTVKVISGERARFEVAGGRRLIVSFDFPRRIAYIKFLGTHAEYDAVDAATIDQF